MIGSVEYFYVNFFKIVDYVNVKGGRVGLVRFCVLSGVLKV